MGKRTMLKSVIKKKATKSFEKRLAKHVRLASWISWLGMPAGIGGRIAVFVVVMLFPVFMWLISAAAVLLLLSGGLVAVHKLDPSIAVEKPKEAEESSGGGGTGGKTVEVPENLKGKFFVPGGRILSQAQVRSNAYASGFHDGIDFSNNRKKTPLYPIYPGTVEVAKWGGLFGNVMVVKHDVEGDIYYSLYAHMDSFTAKVGDTVGYNSELGIMGTTGNSTGIHVHLELHDKNFKWYNRKTALHVANYITCAEGKKLPNVPQPVDACLEYREKMTK